MKDRRKERKKKKKERLLPQTEETSELTVNKKYISKCPDISASRKLPGLDKKKGDHGETGWKGGVIRYR